MICAVLVKNISKTSILRELITTCDPPHIDAGTQYSQATADYKIIYRGSIFYPRITLPERV